MKNVRAYPRWRGPFSNMNLKKTHFVFNIPVLFDIYIKIKRWAAVIYVRHIVYWTAGRFVSTDRSKAVVLMLFVFCMVLRWQAAEPCLVIYGFVMLVLVCLALWSPRYGEERTGRCAGCMVVCLRLLVLCFTTLILVPDTKWATSWENL